MLWVAVSPLLWAQNFNPRVEVTNTYRSNVADVQKQDLTMDVPDSLLNFDYKLDYTVFDHPYKGSYEFRPYLIEMAPKGSEAQDHRLYVHAGAGYTFAPEADFVLRHKFSDAFSGVVYDSFRGYYGRMKAVSWEPSFNGSLYRNDFGFTTEYKVPEYTLDGHLNYRYLNAGDGSISRSLNGLTVGADISAPALSSGSLALEGGVELSFAGDDYKTYVADQLSEFGVGAHVCVEAPVQAIAGSLAAELGMEGAFFGGAFKAHGVHLYAVPKYVLKSDIATLSAGVKLSFLPSSLDGSDFYDYRSALLFPDIHGNVFIYKDRVSIFTDITGGNTLNTRTSVLEHNPFADPGVFNDLDASADRVNASAGIRGNIARYLQFKAWAGYVVAENMLGESYFLSPAGRSVPVFVYEDCRYSQGGVSLDYLGGSLELSALAAFRHTTGLQDAIAPSPFTLDLYGRYNWSGRIFAGAYLHHGSARDNIDSGLSVPAWTDLGLFGEYLLKDNLSLWARLDNILCQDIQQYLMHARRGLNFTVGVCLNIR